MDGGGSHADPVVHDARRKFSSALESNVLDYLHYGAQCMRRNRMQRVRTALDQLCRAGFAWGAHAKLAGGNRRRNSHAADWQAGTRRSYTRTLHGC